MTYARAATIRHKILASRVMPQFTPTMSDRYSLSFHDAELRLQWREGIEERRMHGDCITLVKNGQPLSERGAELLQDKR